MRKQITRLYEDILYTKLYQLKFSFRPKQRKYVNILAKNKKKKET